MHGQQNIKILSASFLILTKIQRHIVINVQISSCKLQLFLSCFDGSSISKTEFRHVLTRFHENSFIWSRVPWGRTGI